MPDSGGIECVEVVVPRCCEHRQHEKDPDPARLRTSRRPPRDVGHRARRLTSGEPQQQTASLTWIYDLVEYFPRVVVTVMYKCSWCFPASLVPTLSAEDRALRERHRSGRRGNDAVDPDDPGVVSLCPGPPGHPFGTDLAKCRGRIREVASFDSCASGNTKEIGAFLRHMLARNASGTLAAQTLLLHSSPGDHFVKVSNAYNEAATN